MKPTLCYLETDKGDWKAEEIWHTDKKEAYYQDDSQNGRPQCAQQINFLPVKFPETCDYRRGAGIMKLPERFMT